MNTTSETTTHSFPTMGAGNIVLAAMYKFVELDDYVALRARYRSRMEALGIHGTILLAPEGINGTISGSREAIDAFLSFLRSDPRLSDLTPKESYFNCHPFGHARVRLKRELISLGVPADPMEHVGTYVKPADWNKLISEPDVVLLDSRNEYETYIGTFKGAIDPNIQNFKELPGYIAQNLDPKKHKRIATFCTGGIRCEKLTAHLLDQGFEEVYHLEGGILKYLEEIPAEESQWSGECYVFDDRVGVGHQLKPSTNATSCPGCGHTLLAADRAHPSYVENAACRYCAAEKQAAAKKA